MGKDLPPDLASTPGGGTELPLGGFSTLVHSPLLAVNARKTEPFFVPGPAVRIQRCTSHSWLSLGSPSGARVRETRRQALRVGLSREVLWAQRKNI